MQTSFIAEETAQTNSDLKRCSGTTYPGDKTRVLREPHVEPTENFHKNSAKPDGLDHRCKSCKSVVNAERKKLPKIAPPEFMTCRECGETKNHSEMRNHSNNRNGKANTCLECDRSNSSQWKKDNPEKNRVKLQRHRDRKRSLPNDGTTREQIFKDFDGTCYLCGGEIDSSDWHADHVWPQSRGGGTVYENYRPTHARCNSSKNDKSYFEIVVGWNGNWKNSTIDNLYLFNMCAQKHSEEIIKQALAAKEAATNSRKENK